MNKFLKFNKLIEIGKVFKVYASYLIALEYFDKFRKAEIIQITYE